MCSRTCRCCSSDKLRLNEVALGADLELVLEQLLQQLGGDVLVLEAAHFGEELVTQDADGRLRQPRKPAGDRDRQCAALGVARLSRGESKHRGAVFWSILFRALASMLLKGEADTATEFSFREMTYGSEHRLAGNSDHAFEGQIHLQDQENGASDRER
jgi:hypothetical protein